MKTNLGCYLGDHLAGAAVAIVILDNLARTGAGEWRPAVSELLRDVKADEQILLGLRRRVTAGRDPWKRQLARWLGKFARRRFSQNGFGIFEAVEALVLGVRGKEALWDALRTIGDPRLMDTDFDELRRRARSQHDVLEKMRLALAGRVLAP